MLNLTISVWMVVLVAAHCEREIADRDPESAAEKVLEDLKVDW